MTRLALLIFLIAVYLRSTRPKEIGLPSLHAR